MERGIAVIDDIVILHKMKSNALQTVVDLSHSFNELLVLMTRAYYEIMIVFDTYCKDVSLKYATSEVRLQGQRPVQYDIYDETGIEHITMFKRFLNHHNTKADLADYMAMKVLTYNTDWFKLVTMLSTIISSFGIHRFLFCQKSTM